VIVVANLYFGIWGGVLDAFSDQKIQSDLLTASRMVEYEKARLTSQTPDKKPLGFFREAEKLSHHQQEIFKRILKDTNRKLLPKYFLLFILITWASIYLTHKIAGPLYRFSLGLHDLGQGNLKTRIRLRRGDEAQSVANEFNLTAETMDRSISSMKNIIRKDRSDPDRMTQRLEEELKKFQSSVDAE